MYVFCKFLNLISIIDTYSFSQDRTQFYLIPIAQHKVPSIRFPFPSQAAAAAAAAADFGQSSCPDLKCFGSIKRACCKRLPSSASSITSEPNPTVSQSFPPCASKVRIHPARARGNQLKNRPLAARNNSWKVSGDVMYPTRPCEAINRAHSCSKERISNKDTCCKEPLEGKTCALILQIHTGRSCLPKSPK